MTSGMTYWNDYAAAFDDEPDHGLRDETVAAARWTGGIDLLASAGRLVLIEGYWHTGGGLPAATLLPLVPSRLGSVGFRLLPDPDLWGGEITDERYLIVARR